MIVSEVMTKEVVTCSENDTLAACAQNMARLNVGSMPVLDQNGNLIGIITDRDITVRAVAKNIDITQAKVGEYASGNLITASPDMSIEEASDLMARNQIRRLPVLENGMLVGIVALGDLAVTSEEKLVGHALHEVSLR